MNNKETVQKGTAKDSHANAPRYTPPPSVCITSGLMEKSSFVIHLSSTQYN